MKLSVIVVSYNVKGYLSLCLDAALVAMDRLGPGASELIVLTTQAPMGQWIGLSQITRQLR